MTIHKFNRLLFSSKLLSTFKQLDKNNKLQLTASELYWKQNCAYYSKLSLKKCDTSH